MIEFKRYEPIKQEERKFRVCICGHYWHKHSLGFFGIIGTCCEKCKCPRYKEIGRFTFRECQDLGVE